MKRKIQFDRLLGWLYLCVFLTVSVVWTGHAHHARTTASQEGQFTGNSFALDSEGVRATRRGFEPGARTNWHTHSAQLLLVQEGRLRYQVEGGPARDIGLHEAAYLPRGIRHWHGAVPGQGLTHVSVTLPNASGERLAIEWMEPVTDEQYARTAER